MRIETTDNTEVFRGYAIRREVWTIAGRRFDLTWPADMDALLDSPETQKRFDRDDYMPYWAQPWPGSILLTEAVLTTRPGTSLQAVEIGCGIGLVGIAAAMQGWAVTASDYDADALAFTELNAKQNGVTIAAYEQIDYRIALPTPQYDCILASDLLYEKKKCEPVARWIASALNPGGYALLSDPNRTAADSFPDHARNVGFDVLVQSVETQSPAGLLIRGRIWRVGIH